MIEAQWEAADVAERRAMLLQALGGNTLYVDKFRHTGKRVFDRNRLRLADPDGNPAPLDAPA